MDQVGTVAKQTKADLERAERNTGWLEEEIRKLQGALAAERAAGMSFLAERDEAIARADRLEAKASQLTDMLHAERAAHEATRLESVDLRQSYSYQVGVCEVDQQSAEKRAAERELERDEAQKRLEKVLALNHDLGRAHKAAEAVLAVKQRELDVCRQERSTAQIQCERADKVADDLRRDLQCGENALALERMAATRLQAELGELHRAHTALEAELATAKECQAKAVMADGAKACRIQELEETLAKLRSDQATAGMAEYLRGKAEGGASLEAKLRQTIHAVRVLAKSVQRAPGEAFNLAQEVLDNLQPLA